MSTIQDIEQAVRNLSREELAAFREWFVEFESQVWDTEFEDDVHSGRLDALAEEALRDHQAGRCTDL